VSHNGYSRQLLSPQEHREWVAAVIGFDDFLNFKGVVAQEEVETVVFGTAVVTVILPEDGKGENLAVIVEETL
jgi:hypothetical protein